MTWRWERWRGRGGFLTPSEDVPAEPSAAPQLRRQRIGHPRSNFAIRTGIRLRDVAFPSSRHPSPHDHPVPASADQSLLQPLLDSWDRNNTILINLLRAVPPGGLAARAVPDSPTVAQLFTHIHFVRMVFIAEDAPEFAGELPEEEWMDQRDPDRIAAMLTESARTVRHAVTARLEAGKEMDMHYDHPILLLQHMVWHEGYHHGQIKIALKSAGLPIADSVAGPATWGVWMKKQR
jgi:uncharacterized damage-inducible protein DinB